MSGPLLIARREADYALRPRMGNRHGLIAGATGTGKTVTLQKMAEEFSRIGVPVFMADVKGDLAGISQPGGDHPKVLERIAQLKVEGFAPEASPVVFWDVRLIRSKAVGVYFITQNPRDVPDNVLGQLGNRVQHALRAFTPSDQKAVRAAAQTFRQNPAIDTEEVLTQLGVGEALVSFLDAKGQPTVVDRALVIPPRSRLGAITESERARIMRGSPVVGYYEKEVDRESAYEKLTAAAQASTPPTLDASTDQKDEPFSLPGAFNSVFGGKTGSRGRRSDSVATAMTKSVMRSVGSSLGRQIARGIMGAILGGTGSRRR